MLGTLKIAMLHLWEWFTAQKTTFFTRLTRLTRIPCLVISISKSFFLRWPVEFSSHTRKKNIIRVKIIFLGVTKFNSPLMFCFEQSFQKEQLLKF